MDDITKATLTALGVDHGGMQTVNKDGIPPNSNPFHYDSVSVGLNLGDHFGGCVQNERLNDVYIMTSGWSDSYDFYIVDKATGERLGIKLPS